MATNAHLNVCRLLADGTVTLITGNGRRIPKKHIFNSFAAHIPKTSKGQHTLLSKYTVVDKSGKVLATYERSGTTWTRTK